MQVNFSDGLSAEHVMAVRRQQLDIAFVIGTAGYDGCEIMPLWSERVFAVLPVDHPLAARSLLSWDDLAGERFIISEQVSGQEILDILIQRFTDLGGRPEVHLHDVSRDNLMSLVAMRRGLTLTSEAMTSTVFNALTYRPIEDEFLPFSAIWSPKNDNPGLRRLISMARDRCSIVEPSRSATGLPCPTSNAVLLQTPDPSP